MESPSLRDEIPQPAVAEFLRPEFARCTSAKMVDSADFAQVLAEAQDIAQSVGQKLTSSHLLLALFTVENRAQLLLRERGIDEDRLLGVMTAAPQEADGLTKELCERSREIAKGCGALE